MFKLKTLTDDSIMYRAKVVINNIISLDIYSKTKERIVKLIKIAKFFLSLVFILFINEEKDKIYANTAIIFKFICRLFNKSK